MSKHCVSKIIILQLFRPFPGETLENELRTKQSTEKLWAYEPKAKCVAEYQAGNEAERQAGDFWKPGALKATHRSVNRNRLHSLEDLKEGLAMIIFTRLYNANEVEKPGFQPWFCINQLCSLYLKSLQRQGKYFFFAFSDSPRITNSQCRVSAGLNEGPSGFELAGPQFPLQEGGKYYLQGHSGLASTPSFSYTDSFSILVAHYNHLGSPRPHIWNPLRFKILGMVGLYFLFFFFFNLHRLTAGGETQCTILSNAAIFMRRGN